MCRHRHLEIYKCTVQDKTQFERGGGTGGTREEHSEGLGVLVTLLLRPSGRAVGLGFMVLLSLLPIPMDISLCVKYYKI